MYSKGNQFENKAIINWMVAVFKPYLYLCLQREQIQINGTNAKERIGHNYGLF